MTLLLKIKNASIDARKERDIHAALLVTLYSEAAMVGKTKRNGDSTDDEVVAVVKKFIAGLNEVIEKSVDPIAIVKASLEIKCLEQFMPEQLSEEKLRELIAEMVEDFGKGQHTLGKIMRELKEDWGSNFDGQLASKIAREMIAS